MFCRGEALKVVQAVVASVAIFVVHNIPKRYRPVRVFPNTPV
jgi:hypothetical protein